MSSLAYLRVSDDEARDRLRAGLVAGYAEARGLGPVQFVESAIHDQWKPVRLDWLIEEKCGAGDNLIVPDFTTIARSVQEFHRVLSVMKFRGTRLHIVDRGILVDPAADAAPAVLNVETAALFAGFEREVMTVSMKEALKPRLGRGQKRRGPGPAQ